MNFLEKLSIKNVILIFLGAVILNLAISVLFFNFKYLPEIISEYQKIADFIQKQVNDNNIEIQITKSGLNLKQENYLIQSKDFPVELNKENLIYIAKNADYSNFKDKNTIAILNDKELVLNLNNEYQNIPVENLIGTNEDIKINKESTKSLIETLFNQNQGITSYLYFAFFVEKALYYVAQFIWGFYILAFVIFYVFKFSGYTIERNLIKALSTLFFALILIIEPLFFYFKLPLGIIHVLFIGFVAITFFLKSKADKGPVSEESA
jgi:hypothetical protein